MLTYGEIVESGGVRVRRMWFFDRCIEVPVDVPYSEHFGPDGNFLDKWVVNGPVADPIIVESSDVRGV